MKERLQALINLEKISPAQFAALVGIQRSTLSNILGGRNKPSYDIILSILTKFPNINTDWLMKGEGTPYKNPELNFRGERINNVENSEVSDDLPGSSNNSDLFGFEEPYDDLPSSNDEEEKEDKSYDFSPSELRQRAFRPNAPSDNAEIQNKKNILQQTVNKRITPSNVLNQPSENRTNGEKSTISRKNRALKGVILLYGDSSFEYFEQ